MQKLILVRLGLIVVLVSAHGAVCGQSFCPGSAVSLPYQTPVSVSNACKPFSLSPLGGQWNVVGVTTNTATTPATDWDIWIGAAGSLSLGANCDFLVANGHLGPITATTGDLERYQGTSTATAKHGATSLLNVGATANVSWNQTTSIVRIFEFETTCAGVYSLSSSGLSYLKWRLFDSGTGPGWRDRSLWLAAGNMGDTSGGYALNPGWHAVVVFKDGIPATSGGNYSLTVNTISTNTPAITSLDPPQILATTSSVQIRVLGQNFSTSSQVRFDGMPQLTTFISSGELRFSLSQSPCFSMGGNHTVGITNSCGTSNAATLQILNPAPAITAVFPVSADCGSAGFQLQISGSGFTCTGSILWNGIALPVYAIGVNTSSIFASIPGSFLNAPGTVSIAVSIPPPGGGISNPLVFTINSIAPSLIVADPAVIVAGSPTMDVHLYGSGFVSGSEARWNGVALPATFIDAFHLRVSVPASLLAAAGAVSIVVAGPPPCGAGSAAVGVMIVNPVPVLTGVTPLSIAAGSPGLTMHLIGQGFVPNSEVHWNGSLLSSTYLNPVHLEASINSALLTVPAEAQVGVVNPGPGGGPSGEVIVPIRGPFISGLTPPALPAPLMPGSAPVPVEVSGSDFLPGTMVHANGVAVPATYLSPDRLSLALGPGIPRIQLPGAVVLTASTPIGLRSNGVAWPLTAASNRGTLGADPPGVLPGTLTELVAEGGPPGAALALFGIAGTPTPVVGWPDPQTNLVNGAGFPGLVVLLDGTGWFGGGSSAAFLPTPHSTPPGGTLRIFGFPMPNPALGITITLQALYPDQTSPVGWTLTWPAGFTF